MLHRISELILKSQRGELLPAEQQELSAWAEGSPERAQLLQDLTEESRLKGQLKRLDGYSNFEELIRDKITARMPGVFTVAPASYTPITTIRKIPIWKRLAIAAAILVLLGSVAWLLMQTPDKSTRPVVTTGTGSSDLPPGCNRAVLTLSGGHHIILDSVANGSLATQGNTQIVKLSNGQLKYTYGGLSNHGDSSATAAISYNTLTTPRGGKYQLVLPDGTGVWLNAASSITYPTAFSGHRRSVKITGEAYFEVAPDRTRPFQVSIHRPSGEEAMVEVLGTHFNINAYGDEADTRATLLEGHVRVRSGASTLMLQPGQQAIVKDGGEVVSNTHPVDTIAIMAWKNGYFSFNRVDIQTVMRQIARWYDVEISYEGPVSKETFVGEIPMDASAAQVLKALEKINVHFTIKGRRIIVRP